MKAVILAAGRGSRMGGLTNDTPKCLLKINNKSLLEMQIDNFTSAGIDEIYVITGYKEQLINDKRVVKIYNPRWSTTNMVRSLFAADSIIKNSPAIISYSDIFYESSAIKSLTKNLKNINLMYSKNWYQLWEKRFDNILSDAESFEINQLGLLIDIGKKVTDISKVNGQYMGLFAISPTMHPIIQHVLRDTPEEIIDKMYMTDLLQKIIDHDNKLINLIPYSLNWGEVDSESDLHYYNVN